MTGVSIATAMTASNGPPNGLPGGLPGARQGPPEGLKAASPYSAAPEKKPSPYASSAAEKAPTASLTHKKKFLHKIQILTPP